MKHKLAICHVVFSAIGLWLLTIGLMIIGESAGIDSLSGGTLHTVLVAFIGALPPCATLFAYWVAWRRGPPPDQSRWVMHLVFPGLFMLFLTALHGIMTNDYGHYSHYQKLAVLVTSFWALIYGVIIYYAVWALDLAGRWLWAKFAKAPPAPPTT
jgi:hypothetical protein